MSEPRIAVKCSKCGEVTLVLLSERALLVEDYFRCEKCGHVQIPRDKPARPEDPTEED
jgi:uncharacterized OB-fold protein